MRTEKLGEEFRSDTFHYFRQECYLAKLLFEDGLKNLYKFSENPFCENGVGYGYKSFFSLSISVERLSKLALIFHYAKTNSDDTQPILLPKGDYIRKQGHDLSSLFQKLAGMLGAESNSNNANFNLSPVAQKILSFLSNFASKSRYENLDKLSGAGSRSEEPLKEWEEILREVTCNFPEDRNRSLYERKLVKISKEIFPDQSFNFKEYSSEHNVELTSFVKDYFGEQRTTKELDLLIKAYRNYFPYLLWYVFEIIKPIIFVLIKWSKEAYEINEKYVYLPFKSALQEKYTNGIDSNVLPKANLSDVPEVWKIFSSVFFQDLDLEDFLKNVEDDNLKNLLA